MNAWGQWGAAAASGAFPAATFPTPPVPPVPPAAAAAAVGNPASMPGYAMGQGPIGQPPIGQPPMGYPYYQSAGAMPGGVPGAQGYPPQQWPMATTPAQQQQWQQWEQWQQQYAQWQAQYGDKYQAMMAMGGMPTAAGVTPLSATGMPPTSNPPAAMNPPLPEKPLDIPAVLLQDKSNKRGYDASKGDSGTASPLQATKKAKKEIKESLDEMTEQEKAFDDQFKNWESQFLKWKEQNINHPDKEQYKEYEAKWESWREQLLQRREQMKKKKEAKMAEERAAALAEATNTKSATMGSSDPTKTTGQVTTTGAHMMYPPFGNPPPIIPSAGFPAFGAQAYPSYGAFPGMMGVPTVGGIVGGTPDLVNTGGMPPDVTVNEQKMNEPPPNFQGGNMKGIPGLDLLGGSGGGDRHKPENSGRDQNKRPPQVPVTEPLMHSSDDKNPFNFPPPSQDMSQQGPGNFQSGPPGFQNFGAGAPNNFQSGGNNYNNNFGPPGFGGPPPFMGQGPMSQGPMSQGPMGQGPMGQGSMGQGPMGQGSMGQGSMGQGPMGQGPMGQGPMGQGPPNFPPPGGPPGNFGNQFGNRPPFDQPSGNYSSNSNSNYPGPNSQSDSKAKKLPGLMDGFDPDQAPPNFKISDRDKQEKFKEWESRYNEENEFENDPFAENNDDYEDNCNKRNKFDGPTKKGAPPNFRGGPQDRFQSGSFGSGGSGPKGRGEFNDRGTDDRSGPRGMDRYDDRPSGGRDRFGGPDFDGPGGKFDGPPGRNFDGPPNRGRGGRFDGPPGRFPNDFEEGIDDQHTEYDMFSGTGDERGSGRGRRGSGLDRGRGGSGPERGRGVGPDRSDRGRVGPGQRGGRGSRFGDFEEPDDQGFRDGPDKFGSGSDEFGQGSDGFGMRGGRRGGRFGHGGRFDGPGERGPPLDSGFEGHNTRPPMGFGGPGSRNPPDFDGPGRRLLDGPGLLPTPDMKLKPPQIDEFPTLGLSGDRMKQGGLPPFPHELKPPLSGLPVGPVAPPPSTGPSLIDKSTVVDYGHRPVPLKANATDLDIPVSIAPMHMFDYQHGAIPGPPLFLNIRVPRPRDFADLERELDRERDRGDSRGRARSREDRLGPRGGRDRDRERDNDRGRGDKERERDRDDKLRRDERDRRDDRDRDRRVDDRRDRDRDGDRGRNDRGRNDRDRDRDREQDRDRERDRDRRREDDKSSDNRSKDQSERRGPRDKLDNQRGKDDKPSRDEPVPLSKQHQAVLVEDLLVSPGREKRPSKILVILRGPPGSGKTFAGKLIKDKEVENGGTAPRTVSLDDYFMCEVEREETDPETKRKFTTKIMEYEFEPEMESHYRQSLIKAIRKNLADGYFPFIILDCINNKLEHYEEIYNFAKQKGFQVYICEMDMDVGVCAKRNIHKRTEKEITEMVSKWEPTPVSQTLLDVRSLLQSAAITEVEMEDTPPVEEPTEVDLTKDQDQEEEKEEEAEEGFAVHVKSKWETDEYSGNKLDRLDGLVKARKHGDTIKEWLQLSEDDFSEYRLSRPNTTGKKRVRWADLEERQEQDKMRAIGFVVGQTDWRRMMDPSYGESKLTQTKYI